MLNRGSFQCTLIEAQMGSRKRKTSTTTEATTTTTTTTTTVETTTMLRVSTTTTMTDEKKMEENEIASEKEREEIYTTEREREREEIFTTEKEESVEFAFLPNTTGALEERSNIEKSSETGEIECGYKSVFDLEKVVMEMILVMSLMLNFYLVLVYPFLIFMGREWFKRQMNQKGKEKVKDRQMLQGMRLDLEEGIERDRQKKDEKKKIRCAWF